MNRNDRKIAIGACAVALLSFIAFFLVDGTQDTTQVKASKVAANHAERQPATPFSGRGGTYASGNTRASRSITYATPSARTVETFPFDPNTADSTQLLRLGLQPWQVKNIYRYRAKGGIYRKKEDFARLYGLTVKEYRRLEPYIRISPDYQSAATLLKGKPRQERDTVLRPIKIDSTQHIVLNTADTNALKKVPGIGSYYARQIVRHGRWLGGYVSVDQLDEIDGFPTASKRYFVVKNATPQRLNVNKLTLYQLKRHPYINYFQAKAIIEYRRLHGPLHSLQELTPSRDFPPEAIQRLEPYIEY